MLLGCSFFTICIFTFNNCVQPFCVSHNLIYNLSSLEEYNSWVLITFPPLSCPVPCDNSIVVEALVAHPPTLEWRNDFLIKNLYKFHSTYLVLSIIALASFKELLQISCPIDVFFLCPKWTAFDVNSFLAQRCVIIILLTWKLELEFFKSASLAKSDNTF